MLRRRLLRESMRWVRAAVATAPLMDCRAIVIPLSFCMRAIASRCSR